MPTLKEIAAVKLEAFGAAEKKLSYAMANLTYTGEYCWGDDLSEYWIKGAAQEAIAAVREYRDAANAAGKAHYRAYG